MSSNTISFSSELMDNYLQSVIVSPQKKFQALQTADANALLFSIGSDNVFYLIAQTPGSSTGWEQYDLSSMLKVNYSNQNMAVKNFAAAQNVVTGNIDLALVVSSSGGDFLYLSLNNSNQSGAITSSTVQWQIMPYDDPQHPGIQLSIENIYISETKQQEYVVADISKKAFTPPSDFIERYYIDPLKANKKIWNNMVIGGDLSPINNSILGRKSGDRVDGTYTLGSINGTNELVYAPLYNAWDPVAPPTVTRLIIPQGASAISTISKSDNSTDLFLAANGTLYYFASDKQQDGASGVSILQNDLLNDVVQLYSASSGSNYVVWGLNRDNQIFYTSCNINAITNNGWSYPVPILEKVEQVTPYINSIDNSNVFFAVTGNTLTKAVQSPETSIWSFKQIHLKAPVNAPAASYHSYTTRISYNDQNQQVLANQNLYISTDSSVAVYINNVYYILDTTPIPVQTDNAGSITIVELANELSGTKISVSEKGGVPVLINPMDKPFNKSATLNSADKLKAAQVYNNDGSSYSLVPQNTSSDLLNQVANANTQLAQAYTHVSNPQTAQRRMTMSALPGLTGFADAIAVDVGDLFSWLESGISHVIQLVEDAATGFWHFVVTIGDKIYQGILDCVEKVVGAVKWIYNIIKVAFEDLMKFLSFLFEWNDIKRTKEVLKNVTKLYLQNQVDQIEVIKSAFDQQIQNLVKAINGWSGIDNWSGLGAPATAPTNSSSTPGKGLDAPSTLMSYHFQNNANNINTLQPSPVPSPSQNPIDTLFDALKKEGVIMDNMIDQLQQLASDYTNMNLESILKRLIGILADTVLLSAQNVIDALFDIIYEIASAAVSALDTPIYIPVLSDLLKDIGVPSFSLLDVLCYVAAVPITIGYKIVHGSAPFQDDENTQFIINANSWDSLLSAFSPVSEPSFSAPSKPGARKLSTAATATRTAEVEELISMPDSVANAIFISGHTASGFFTLMSDFISTFEALEPTGENPFGTPSAVLGVLSAVTGGAAGVLVPKDPIKNTVVSWVSSATTGSVILAKIIFSGPAQSKFASATGIMKNLKAGDGRATGAIVNSILIIPALFCTVWHFVELAETDSSNTRSAAIIEETSNITAYISRISYTIAVNDPDEETKAIAVGVMAVANIATSGLQTAEAIVGSM